MMKLLEITLGFIVGAVIATMFVNATRAKQEQDVQVAAIQSITNAGKALLHLEKQNMRLPGSDWEKQVEDLLQGQSIKDPSFTGEKSGWGRNMRTTLTLGQRTPKDPPELTTNQIPGDAILLMAANESTVTPYRDGTLPKSELPDPLERHGRKSPVFCADGHVELLDKAEITDRLAIRKTPPSRISNKLQAENNRRIKEAMEAKQDSQKIYAGYVTLDAGEIKTPGIPITGELTEISFETNSTEKSGLDSTIFFLNQDGREINYLPQANIIEAKSHIDLASRPPSAYTGNHKKVGFNAQNGAAEVITDAAYIKGTKIAEITDTTQTQKHWTGTEWQTETIQLNKQNLPPGTKAIKLSLHKSDNQVTTVIRNIRIGPAKPTSP